MAICSISVVPIGTGSTSVSSYVAMCHDILKGAKGVKYRLTPMATIIEGDLERLLELAGELHRVPFAKGAHRVLTTIILDDRTDKALTMEGKIESVERKLE